MNTLMFVLIAEKLSLPTLRAAVRNSVPTNAECFGIIGIRIKRDGRIQAE